MPTQLELENTPEAMEARRREFAETAARTRAGLSQFAEPVALGAIPPTPQAQPIKLNFPSLPQAPNPRQLSPLLAGLVSQTTPLPSLPNLPSLEGLAPLPPLTSRAASTIPLPQAPALPAQERREVPVLTSEPARRELADITTGLTQLEQQTTSDFTRAEQERQTFIESQRAASEQQRAEEERRAKELEVEAVSEREELGQRRLRAFEAQAATAGATRTSAALIELGGVERETQRDIQSIRRQAEAMIGQARTAAAERDVARARQSFEMVQTLRTQLAQRQQQSFENRLNIERLQDQRQQEDFSRRQAVAQFNLATREFDEESVQREFGRAMQQAQFELNTRQAEQEEAQREFNRAQADSQLLLEVRRAQLQARQVLTEEQQQDFQNRLALTKFNSDEVQSAFNRVMAIEDFESRRAQQEFQNALGQANFELDTQRLRLQASQVGAEETQRSFTNQLALAQQRLAEQQETRRGAEAEAELELRSRAEKGRLELEKIQEQKQQRDLELKFAQEERLAETEARQTRKSIFDIIKEIPIGQKLTLPDGTMIEGIKTIEKKEQAKPSVVQEYEYYAQQEQAAGKKPVSFNEYQNIDANRKRAIVNNYVQGGLTKEQFSRLNAISDNMRLDPNIKDFTAVRSGFETARGARQSKNSAGDIVLMRMLAKITDPTTGVREEEYKTFKDAIGTLPRYGLQLTKGMVGAGQLTENGRDALFREIQKIYIQRLNAYNNSADIFARQAQKAGGSIEDILPTYVAPEEIKSGSTGLPVGSIRTTADGKKWKKIKGGWEEIK